MTAELRRQLLDAIRKAIETSPVSVYEVAQRSGVDKATLSRFMNGKASLSVDAIERIAPVVGIEIVVVKKKPKKK